MVFSTCDARNYPTGGRKDQFSPYREITPFIPPLYRFIPQRKADTIITVQENRYLFKGETDV
jgi:hypothetical protein